MSGRTEQQDRLRQALSGSRGEDQQRIAEAGLQLIDTLLRKNKDYGGSAWKPPLFCPGMSPREGIFCRMSDKAMRIVQLQQGQKADVKESLDDTVLDLGGYAILWASCPEADP